MAETDVEIGIHDPFGAIVLALPAGDRARALVTVGGQQRSFLNDQDTVAAQAQHRHSTCTARAQHGRHSTAPVVVSRQEEVDPVRDEQRLQHQQSVRIGWLQREASVEGGGRREGGGGRGGGPPDGGESLQGLPP